jgi:hypothetical protein
MAELNVLCCGVRETALGMGELLKPILRIARGIAHHLQAQRLKIGTRELGPLAQQELG